ncbi:MAG: homoserine dehydrogenase [Nitrospinae bacterium RIFCSPLOWO2_12_FULL_45_22]|nr:MAG: homoserine dehydrogenase [Nitrospinae bacterium RIFCSPLOWO2_12_FULL_45_22]
MNQVETFNRPIYIGIIGLGTVGTGAYKILTRNNQLIKKRLGVPLEIKRIADLDLDSDRGIPSLNKDLLTTDAYKVIDDPEIDIAVELIGGLEPAKTFILRALDKGKHVVTANKALLAHYGHEIFQKASHASLDVGFEASVGGGIPIIRAIREGFAANNIEAIYGIVNGTANYILSKMTNEGGDFTQVLEEAQRKGYAEQDPSLDIEGIDSAHKITILASLAFGANIPLSRVYTEGIAAISPLDIQYARHLGYRIKLLAIAKRVGEEIDIRVHPTLLPQETPLANVDNILNALYIVGDAVGKNMFVGEGAGAMPTGSAVVGDIIEVSRNILRGQGGRVPALGVLNPLIADCPIRKIGEIRSEYYLRFMAVDQPGVLARISGILGDHSISIASVLQKDREPKEGVPVVMMTHEALEKDIQLALKKIDQLEVVLARTTLIRAERDIS